MRHVMMSLRTEVIEDVAGLVRLVPAWRALLARSSAPSPSKTPTWLLAWWRQFGGLDGRKLCVIAAHDNATGELVGLVPMCRRTVMVRRVVPIRRLELLATGEDHADEICSDYTGAIVARRCEAEVARAMARLLVSGRLDGFDHLVMERMAGEDPFTAALAAALDAHGVPATVAEEASCPYIPLPGSFDAYKKQLDSDARYVVNRALRELDKWAGKAGYTRVVARTPAELAEGRAILHSLHGERWSGSGRSDYEGVFASERFTRFHDEVMAALLDSPDGKLELQWLVVDGRPVVALYNIVYGGRVYFYQSGRKLDVPKGVKLGLAAHALALGAAIEDGHTEYDFLAGESQYKRQLALAKHPLVTLTAAAPSMRARTAVAAASALNQGLRRARRELAGQRDRLAAVDPAQRSRAASFALTALNRILPPSPSPSSSSGTGAGQGT
ncbi:MAG TPA: GNAT family N-acetyltransferase [Kofleriaceae bacterium]|nr:GNAT family N-acetyltransferase [Kofleriaceae bacterium]